MALSWSHELCAVFDEAERDALASREALSTAHLLQAFVTMACEAEPFMKEQRLDEAAIYAVRRHVPPEREGTLQRVIASAERMAERAGAAGLSSLHVLNAFCRQSACEAHELLTLLHFDVEQVRQVTTSMVVEQSARGGGGRRSRHSITLDPDRKTPPPRGPESRHHSPLPISFHPALMGRAEDEGEEFGSDPDDFLEEVWPKQSNSIRTPAEGVMRLELEEMDLNDASDFDADLPEFNSEPGGPSPLGIHPPPRYEPSPQGYDEGAGSGGGGRMSIFTPPPHASFPKVRPSTQRKRSRWGRPSERARRRDTRARKKRSLGLIRPGRKESEAKPAKRPSTQGRDIPSRPKASGPSRKARQMTPPDVPRMPMSKSTGKRKRDRLTARESQEKTAASLAERLFEEDRELKPKSIIEEEQRHSDDAPKTPEPRKGTQRVVFYRGRDKKRKPIRPPASSDAEAPKSTQGPAEETRAKVAAERSSGSSSGGRSPIIRTPRALAERFRLPARAFPTLNKYGTNLLMRAVEGGIDEVIGREREIAQLTDILNKRRSNNPILIGPAGVGKTAIVEGLALKMVQDDPPPGLEDRRLIALDLGTLLCGTHLRGSFQERLTNIKAEVRKAGGKIILFLDEVHTWLGNGKGEGTSEAAGELKTALARGELPCIGATTIDEFKRFVEADPAFERRFDVIEVKPPSPEESIRIIQGIIDNYEEHHQIGFARDAIEASVQLSERFIRERQLPDKAISVLDRAGAVARRLGSDIVGRPEVASVISDLAAVPSERLLMADRDRFLHMEETVSAQLIGHQHVIDRLARVIRRNYAGFASDRPIGSFLFLGPTGVGKTELVKVLADFLFGSRNAVVRLDMSEYMEQHAVARLIGAPPGYVGFEDGGQLTEALRRKPYQVVLLDEIEKAHPDILNLFLQLLDEGRLTDGRGRTVDFRNAVIIMTSNLGAAHFARQRGGGGIGFASSSAASQSDAARKVEASVIDTARKAFPIELWNRIEERLVFRSLSEGEVARIAALQLRESSRRLESERDVRITYAPSLIPFLIQNGGYDPELGARPMRQTIQRFVEDAVAEALLSDTIGSGDIAHVIAEDDAIVVQRREGEEATTSA